MRADRKQEGQRVRRRRKSGIRMTEESGVDVYIEVQGVS